MPGYRSRRMVGRDRELDALRKVAARVRDGEPATVLVLGEAGIGKTRLVAELVIGLAGEGWLCPVSHGVALAGGELPFGATGELLRSLARHPGVDEVRRVLGRQVEQLAAIHPPLGDADGTGSVDRAGVTAALLGLLEGLGRPVCWFLDYLQWMDAATRDMVAYLARVVTGAPVLLLATVRTDPAAPTDLPDDLVELGRVAEVLGLEPLTRAAVASQIATIPGTELDEAAVSRICEISDGLPFFVEQLVASRGRATGSLRAVVLAGFRGLTPQARSVLAAGAVGEGLLIPEHLRQVSGLGGAFDRALAEVRDQGVLLPDAEGGLLVFRHALLREALDAEMVDGERQAWHRAWADLIDSVLADTSADRRLVMERARHRYAVGGVGAFPAVLAAAEAAELADDDTLRVRWWERALELWPGPSAAWSGTGVERDLALSRYAEALWAVGRPFVLDAVLERELADELDWLRRLWLEAARRQALRAMQVTHEPVLPPVEAETTVARLRGLPPDFRVTWLLCRLADDWATEHPDLAIGMLEEALARADPSTDAAVVQEAYSLLGWCERGRGDPDGQVRRMQQAVAWTERHRPSALLSARVSLCASLVDGGRYADAGELGAENLREIRDPRMRPTLWVVQNLLLAAVTLNSGDWERTTAFLEAADTPACGGDLASWRDAIEAVFWARRGDVVRASEAHDRIPGLPADAPVGWAGSHEGIGEAFASIEVAAAEGDGEAARAGFLRVVELSHPVDPPLDLWESCAFAFRVAVDRGARDPASLAYLSSVAGHLDARPPYGRIELAARREFDAHRRRVEDADTAEEWASAAAGWSELGRVYDVTWCRLFEAECALRDGDRARARDRLRMAWDTCRRLQAVPLQERVEATARRGRLAGVGDRPAKSGLTARETEVLVLIAEGRTNTQIAQALFMSPKTVSVHVSHIIAKLGVANRTEAAARAHRDGLTANQM